MMLSSFGYWGFSFLALVKDVIFLVPSMCVCVFVCLLALSRLNVLMIVEWVLCSIYSHYNVGQCLMMCNSNSGIDIGIGFQGFSGMVELELESELNWRLKLQEYRLSVSVKPRTDKISVISNWLWSNIGNQLSAKFIRYAIPGENPAGPP